MIHSILDTSAYNNQSYFVDFANLEYGFVFVK